MEWGVKSMSGMAKSQRWGWLELGQNALCLFEGIKSGVLCSTASL